VYTASTLAGGGEEGHKCASIASSKESVAQGNVSTVMFDPGTLEGKPPGATGLQRKEEDEMEAEGGEGNSVGDVGTGHPHYCEAFDCYIYDDEPPFEMDGNPDAATAGAGSSSRGGDVNASVANSPQQRVRGAEAVEEYLSKLRALGISGARRARRLADTDLRVTIQDPDRPRDEVERDGSPDSVAGRRMKEGHFEDRKSVQGMSGGLSHEDMQQGSDAAMLGCQAPKKRRLDAPQSHSSSAFRVGDTCLARYKPGLRYKLVQWFECLLVEEREDGTWKVAWKDGDTEDTIKHPRHLKRAGNSHD